MNTKYRTEHDSMGELQVPADALWGAQTQRAVQNFPISGLGMPREFIRALGLIKSAAAKVNTDLGLLDAEKSAAIQAAAARVESGEVDQHFPIDVFQTGSGTSSNMNANEVISHLANEGNELGVHPNDHVNMGQSSNDVIPTAIQVSAALVASQQLIPSLLHLAETLDIKSEELHDVVKTGRTHLMDAMPVTFGQELACWSAQIRDDIKRIKSALKRLRRLPQGGSAVGTGINAHPEFGPRVAAALQEATGVKFKASKNYFVGISSQDASVELSGQLKTLACSLMKIGNDLRLMNSGPLAGIGEIELPALQPGSSIMPGKVNPVIPEAVCMVCAQVMGNHTTVTVAGSNGHFELNVFKPVLIYALLQSAKLIGDACDSFRSNCVEGILANEERIEALMTQSLMLVTALNPHIGYDNAAKVAKKAYQENTTLKAAAVALGLLTEANFDKLVRPGDMLGPRAAKK